MNNSALAQQSARDLALIKWRTLHLRLSLAGATILLIFIAPSLLNKSDRLQVIGRIAAPVITILGGAIILKSTAEIELLAPLVELIHNQNLALLKHGLNAQTYVETKSNSLHAAKTVMALSESLEPEVNEELPPEVSTVEVPTTKHFPDSEADASLVAVSDGSSEYSQQELERVCYAIAEGFSDSVIVEQVLNCKGRNFAKGKEKLLGIKKQLGLK